MKSIILCFTAFLCTNLFAYPIEPRPLRILVEESSYIIVGYVTKIEDNRSQKDDWGSSKAVIEVREILKGSIDKKIIKVPFEPNMFCPTPPNYVDTSLVLAFLNKEKGVYYTQALSYGAKTLKAEEIEIYKSRIKEIQEIQKITAEKEKFIQTIDWLVTCAENPITRWEGTYELSPKSDFMSFYQRNKTQKFGLALENKQKARLKAVLFAKTEDTEMEYTDFGIVDLIYNEYTEEIDKLLIGNLKSVDKENFWFADNYMKRLSHRTNNPRALKIAQEFFDLYFKDYELQNESKKVETLRNLIKEFIAIVE